MDPPQRASTGPWAQDSFRFLESRPAPSPPLREALYLASFPPAIESPLALSFSSAPSSPSVPLDLSSSTSSNTKAFPSALDLLPLDILRLIVQYFPFHARLFSLSLVSKRWFSLAREGITSLPRSQADPSLVRRFPSLTSLEDPHEALHFFPPAICELKLTSPIVPVSVLCAPNTLTSLSMAGLTPVAVELLQEVAHRLIAFELVIPPFGSAPPPSLMRDFKRLRFSSLRSLTLNHCTSAYLQDIIPCFHPYLSQLTSLSFDYHKDLSEKLLTVHASLTNLRHLSAPPETAFALAPVLTSLRSIQFVTRKGSHQDVVRLTTLAHLQLSFSYWYESDFESLLGSTLEELRYLRSIEIHGATLTEAAALPFSETLTSLSILHIRPCATKEEVELPLPHLSDLTLDTGDIVALASILRACPVLRRISVRNFEITSAAHFDAFCRFLLDVEARGVQELTVTSLTCPAGLVKPVTQVWRQFVWLNVFIRTVVIAH